MPLSRLKLLLDELARLDRTEGRWRAVEGPVLEAFEGDRRRYSNVLEPSITADPRGVWAYCFSYGFPGFRGDTRRVARTLLALARVVGGGAVEAAGRFLRAAEAPCVEQPMVGFGHDLGGTPVLKLYLQFRPDADAPARRLAARVLGSPRPVAPVRGALHLLGLDAGEGGLCRAKLYALHPVLPWAGAARDLGIDADAVPRDALRDALLIYELRSPDDPAPAPTAVDLPLRAQGLTFRELAPRLARFGPGAVELLGDLGARFPLLVRRVSIGAGARPKLNLYYVLVEPGSGVKPPAGG